MATIKSLIVDGSTTVFHLARDVYNDPLMGPAIMQYNHLTTPFFNNPIRVYLPSDLQANGGAPTQSTDKGYGTAFYTLTLPYSVGTKYLLDDATVLTYPSGTFVQFEQSLNDSDNLPPPATAVLTEYTTVKLDNIRPNGVLLEWTQTNGATSYRVQFKKSSTNVWTTAYDTDASTLKGNLTDLISNTPYDFRVYPLNELGLSVTLPPVVSIVTPVYGVP